MSVHAMSSEHASRVKREGHKKEEVFHHLYGDSSIDFTKNASGASADNYTGKSNQITARLNDFFRWSRETLSISLKGGNTIQILLGNFPELQSDQIKIGTTPKGNTKVTYKMTFDEQLEVLRSRKFWNRVLKKGDIDLMCYFYTEVGEYLFFNMDDVVEFICEKIEWHSLETGRLKGWYEGKQYLTFEYRRKKKTFVLGAHGGQKGREFVNMLRENIPSLSDVPAVKLRSLLSAA